MRVIVLLDLHWDPPIQGNYHLITLNNLQIYSATSLRYWSEKGISLEVHVSSEQY